MWGGVIPYKTIQNLFVLLPSLLPLLQVDAFILTAVSACITPCDKLQMGSGNSKNSKNGPKMRVLEFCEYEIANGLLTF